MLEIAEDTVAFIQREVDQHRNATAEPAGTGFRRNLNA